MSTAVPGMDESLFRSQYNEDRILLEYFGGKPGGYFVEVGGFNGVDFSNTYAFEKIGWKGVIVEPHPVLAQACRDARPGSAIFEAAVTSPGGPATVDLEVPEGGELYSSLKMDRAQLDKARRNTADMTLKTYTVPARTLDSILDAAGAPEGGIDFITVDVEGCERSVLEGFDIDRWRPRVVILERDLVAPEVWIMRHMTRRGYVFGLRTGVNDWYFRRDDGSSRRLAYLGPLICKHYLARPAIAAVKAVLRPVARPIKKALGRDRPAGRPSASAVSELVRTLPSPDRHGG